MRQSIGDTIEAHAVEIEKVSVEMKNPEDQIEAARESLALKAEEISALTASVDCLQNSKEVINADLTEQQNDANHSKDLVANLESKLKSAQDLLSETNDALMAVDRDAVVALLESQIKERDGTIQDKATMINDLREQLLTLIASIRDLQ